MTYLIKRILNLNYAQKYLYIGFLFGFLFPLIAIPFRDNTRFLTYIIWTAPLILGLLSYVAGRHYDKFTKSKNDQLELDKLNKRLEYLQILSNEVQNIAHIGGWEYDLNTQKMSWTEQAYKIFNLPTSTQITAATHFTYFKKESHETIITHFLKCKKGEHFKDTYEFIDACGFSKWVEIAGKPITNSDGQIVKLRGTFRDVTIEHQQKIELNSTKEKLEEAQRVAKIGSWSYELTTKRIFWSKQMFELFPEDIKLGPPSFEKHYSTIHPDDQMNWTKTVNQCISDGKPYKIRFRSVFKDKILWIEAIGHGVRNDYNKIVLLSGTCQDVTEIVETEKNIAQERAKVLHNAKLASLGEMAAGIAHEINNPLAVISGNVSLLKKHITDTNKFEQKISIILRSVERIAKIVRGLKKFSRSNEDVSSQKVESIKSIIQDALILTEAKSKRHFIPITFNQESDYQIICDAVEIEQVLVNLISNGIDAVKELPEKWVKINAYTQDEYGYLQVIDSGSGIATEIECKIFQPFFTTKQVGEGTGLGLSIVKGILDQHKASITINKKFKNTCFEIKFPLVKSLRKAV